VQGEGGLTKLSLSTDICCSDVVIWEAWWLLSGSSDNLKKKKKSRYLAVTLISRGLWFLNGELHR